jgi:hypothetical protein
MTASACTSAANTNGATIQNVTITGGECTVRADNVTLSNVTTDSSVKVVASASGTRILGSRLQSAYIFGGDNTTIENTVIDCNGQVKDGLIIWDEPAGDAPNGFTIRNGAFRNCKDTKPDDHSQAIYVGGYAQNGLIEGNTFTNNGSTSHIFFTWFGNQASTSGYPRNICVRGNTFGATAGAYFDVNFRAEIPSNANIRIQRDASNTDPEFYADC